MSLTILIKIDFPDVAAHSLEDFLATDELFVEYFNAFLCLPVFPEPLWFNKTTGGFEVLNDAKKDLSRKIKAAVRSQKRPPSIYKLTRNHCYSDLPLLPVEPHVEQENKEIETSFSVTTLNKEQAISWVKEQRLPAFIQSKCYHEYKLAKILSQVKVEGPNGEYIIMEVDHRPELKQTPSQIPEVEVTTTPVADVTKGLYLSMGETSTSQVESFYTKLMDPGGGDILATDSRLRPISAITDDDISRKHSSGRPSSVYSNPTTDSGYISPAKSFFGSPDSDRKSVSRIGSAKLLPIKQPPLSLVDSKPGSAKLSPIKQSTSSICNVITKIQNVALDDSPLTPRPTDTVYEVLPGHEYQPPVYYKKTPKDADHHSNNGIKSNHGLISSSHAIQDDDKNNILVGTLDEVGAQLVSTALRQSIAEVNGVPLFELPNLPEVDRIVRESRPLPEDVRSKLHRNCMIIDISTANIPNPAKRDVTANDVFMFTQKGSEPHSLVANKDAGDNGKGWSNTKPIIKSHNDVHASSLTVTDNSQASTVKFSVQDENSGLKCHHRQLNLFVVKPPVASKPPGVSKPFRKMKSQSGIVKEKGATSDTDSLLDSEDDYDVDDTLFRRSMKKRAFTLADKRGVDEFQKFIEGSVAESLWNLWLDIEKSNAIDEHDAKSTAEFLARICQKYQLPGADNELKPEISARLGLADPVWTMSMVKNAQNKALEPLLLYWATKFLSDRSNTLPNHQPATSLPRPRSHVPPLPLPHRPRTCRPRLQSGAAHFTRSSYWTSVKDFSSGYQVMPPDIDTPDNVMHMQHPCGDINTWLNQLDYHAPRTGFRRTYLPTALIKTFPIPTSPPPQSDEVDKSKFVTPRMIVDKLKKSRERSVSARIIRRGQSIPAPQRSRTNSSLSQISDDKIPIDQSDDDGIGLSDRDTQLSPCSNSSDETMSDFYGGRRMEALLQALSHEMDAGGFFRQFVERSRNELWVRNLDLWHAIQDYHKLFYQDKMDEYTVSRKALTIFSTYVVDGAPSQIEYDATIRKKIHKTLYPPYEDIFDAIEEMALDELYDAWTDMLSDDLATYSRVEQVEIKRHIETKSKFVLNLEKKGIFKERVQTPEDPMAGYEDPVYDPTLIDHIPDEFRNYTLNKLMRNRMEVESFREFLAKNYAATDLQCWMDIESFRRLPPDEEKKCDNKAKDIRIKYLNKKYFFGPSSPAGKAGQDKVMEAGGGWGKLLDDRPPNTVLIEVQKYVQDRLEKKWLMMYLGSEEFLKRQSKPRNIEDIIDDMVLHKRHKAQNVLKLMESKWVSSSKDIIAFRKALLNPITSHHFQRYVSIKGDNLENDVLFWHEVQKYKEIHQGGCDEGLITSKIAAIIGCFIDSNIAPAIQIDITAEQAEKVLDRKHEKGPYLFRDAQLTVFRTLFTHWNDFCDYRSKIAETKILSTIERRRKQAKKVERARRRQYDEQERIRQEYERGCASVSDRDYEDGEYNDYLNPVATDSVMWTYSQYMAGLKHEEMLNNGGDVNSHVSLCESGSLKSLGNGGDAKKVEGEVPDSKSTQSTEKTDAPKVTRKVSLQSNEVADIGKCLNNSNASMDSSKGTNKMNRQPNGKANMSASKVLRDKEKTTRKASVKEHSRTNIKNT